MDAHIVNSVQTLLRQAASLLIYQSVLDGAAGRAFLDLLQAIRYSERNVAAEHLDCLHAYGHWFRILASTQQSWQGYLLQRVLRDENPFTCQVQQGDLSNLSPSLIAAVRHDLQILQNLYECSGEQLSHWVKAASHLSAAPVAWKHQDSPVLDELRSALETKKDWAEAVELLTTFYRQSGVGLFGVPSVSLAGW
jgi:hypothetical protein